MLRVATWIAAVLGLGLLTTLGVAAGLVYAVEFDASFVPSTSRVVTAQEGDWTIAAWRARRWGSETIWIQFHCILRCGNAPRDLDFDSSPDRQVFAAFDKMAGQLGEPRASRLVREWARPSPSGKGGGFLPARAVIIEERGWPLLSVCWQHDINGRLLRPLKTFSSSKGYWIPEGGMPYRAVWSGLAIDAVAFGGLWAILLFVPGLVRRVVRKQRGYCWHCGYDLKHDLAAGCPECGWGRQAA